MTVFFLGELLADIIVIGYSGKDEKGNHTFNRSINVNMVRVFWPSSPKVFWDNWNLMIQQWLKLCLL